MEFESPEVSQDALSSYERRVIVAGSRNFNQFDLFSQWLENYLKCHSEKSTVLISGDALHGADAMVIEWAVKNSFPFVRFPADWDRFQKQAGILRNEEMQKVATHLLAFWDCQSRGTADMIRRMHLAGKPKTVVLIYADRYYQ